MKKTAIYILLLFSIVNTINAQWEWQHPLPQGNGINDVYFVDSQIGFAVGRYGTIMKTTDGGTNWQMQDQVTTNELEAVHFVDSLIGYATGERYLVLKTVDGGDNWSIVKPEIPNSLQGCRDIYFMNADTGFILTMGVERTIDGGQTWTTVSGTLHAGTHTAYEIQFLDSLNGYVCAKSGIWKSSDGGNNWSLLQSPGGTTMFFHNTDTAFFANNGTILSTTNAGFTWTPQSLSFANPMYDMTFTDINTGFALCPYSSRLFTTNDGGLSWDSNADNLFMYMNAIEFTDPQHAFMMGEYGKIVNTSDSGSTWSLMHHNNYNNLYGVHFPAADTGYVVGGIGTIMKTTNGGNDWNELSSGTQEPLNDVYFFDTQIGIAVGDSGATVLKTIDGGQTWVSKLSDPNLHLKSISFPNSNLGFACGTGGSIMKSTNIGETWVQVASTGPYDKWNSIMFANDSVGYAVSLFSSPTSKIIKTDDGGDTWTFITSMPNGQYNSLHVLDENTVYLAGYGEYKFTTDGGISWMVESNDIFNGAHTIYYSDNNTGFILGQEFAVTANAGLTWDTYRKGPTYNDMDIASNGRGYAVGDNGTIVTFQFSNLVANFEANNTTVTFGDTVQFSDLSTGNPISWFWDFGDGSTDTTQNPDHVYQTAGLYTVTLIISDGIESDTIIIQDYILVEQTLLVDVIVTNLDCYESANGAIDMSIQSGQAPYTISWSNGASAEDLMNLVAGIYQVTVLDANAAIYEGIFDITQPDSIHVPFVFDDFLCYGDSVQFQEQNIIGGIAPYTLNWNTTNPIDTSLYLYGGSYALSVTDANGCINAVSATISQPSDLQLSANITHLINPNIATGAIEVQATGGTAPYDYSWSNGATTASIIGLSYGNYMLTITDNNQCWWDNSYTIHVLDNIEITDVAANQIMLYQNQPNPFTDATSISFYLPELSRVEVAIYSVLGEKLIAVHNGSFEAGKHEISFVNKRLSTGTYYYSIKTDKGVFTRKMIVYNR